MLLLIKQIYNSLGRTPSTISREHQALLITWLMLSLWWSLVVEALCYGGASQQQRRGSDKCSQIPWRYQLTFHLLSIQPLQCMRWVLEWLSQRLRLILIHHLWRDLKLVVSMQWSLKGCARKNGIKCPNLGFKKPVETYPKKTQSCNNCQRTEIIKYWNKQ